MTFEFIGEGLPCFESAATKEYLLKWGIIPSHRIYRFRSSESIAECRKESFLKSFLSSAAVRECLKGSQFDDDEPTFNELRRSEASLRMFNRLIAEDIVSDSKYIRGKIESYLGSFPIGDYLLEALLCSDSDKFLVFSESERKEIIFRVLKHLYVGAGYHQREASIEHLIEVTRLFLKNLLSVVKNDSGDLEIKTLIFEIKSDTQNDDMSFRYIFFDPFTREVILWFFDHNKIW